jgi:hypothetical protein
MDKKLLYSKAVINAGLLFEGYRDAVRTNNGIRMTAYNKLHLIEFYNCRHPTYFKYCVMWQAMKAGWAEDNVVFDLVHNATINLTGKVNLLFFIEYFVMLSHSF